MKRLLVMIVCFLLVLGGGCAKQTEVPLDKEEVLAYADPITDNLLAGFNEGDYGKFSRDFDEQMKNGLTEPVFKQTREQITSKIGLYQSRTVSRVEKEGPATVVVYAAEFEKESGVEVKVVFQKYGERNLVSGLWFNSPKLRE